MSDSTKIVAAYCRVSTDYSEQANSLQSQQRYFNDFISRNPMWKLYEIYVDEGVSGTSTQKRVAFNKMIEDAKLGRFDLIITKEISRFARNTLDSIAYTRRLKTYGVGVIFMNDGINTLEPDAELRLTIMSSIAQEESRKTSDRVKWGQRRMMEKGVVFGGSLLGYDVKNGKITLNQEGAKTVKLIYNKFLIEGKGTHTIARELREEGIKTSENMKDWSYTSILRILKNEKYCGDLIQQKTFTPDFLSHSKKYNNGELEYIKIANHHEPIISKEMFTLVQKELKRRQSLHNAKNGFANRYALSGKIRCGNCGSTFVHRKRKDKVSWVCIKKQKYGKSECGTQAIKDADLQLMLKHIISRIKFDNRKITDKIISKISKCSFLTNEYEYLSNAIEKNKKKKEKLLDLYLSSDVNETEYHNSNNKLNIEYDMLITRLNKEREKLKFLYDREKLKEDITDYIASILNGEEWSDAFYKAVVDKIIINENRNVEIYLKSCNFVFTARVLIAKECSK